MNDTHRAGVNAFVSAENRSGATTPQVMANFSFHVAIREWVFIQMITVNDDGRGAKTTRTCSDVHCGI